MTELDSIIVYTFVARLGERFILSLVVISIALVSMIAFWRSVQRIDFSLSQDKLGSSASIAFATPLFVLLVVVGFAYISYAHPVSVALPLRTDNGAAPQTSGNSLGTVTLTGAAGIDVQPTTDDYVMRFNQARTALRSLNCIVQVSKNLSTRDEKAVDSAKVALILDVWQLDWGDPDLLGAWALAGQEQEPVPEVLKLYQGVHEKQEKQGTDHVCFLFFTGIPAFPGITRRPKTLLI